MNADHEEIQQAADVLRAGGLVAFATETVYGLGANATNAEAVQKIFTAKGRPGTNPLIVHIADIESAKRYTTRWTDAAQSLAAAFWPGPLTLVLPKTPDIPDIVTAGLGSVGMRAPNHPIALELLRAFGGPVAAPSANRSNRVSPTTADHVRDELGESVDVILDGGSCEVGIESTVLDLSGDVYRILRPGAVTRDQIERVIGRIEESKNSVIEVAQPAVAPGQHRVHYAPKTPAFRFETPQRSHIGIETIAQRNEGLIAIGSSPDGLTEWGPIVVMPCDPARYARHLYEVLRDMDQMRFLKLWIEMPPDSPEWTAVRDRLQRATRELLL